MSTEKEKLERELAMRKAQVEAAKEWQPPPVKRWREHSSPASAQLKRKLMHFSQPDFSAKCETCGATPVMPLTGMCGPCTTGEASTAGGKW